MHLCVFPANRLNSFHDWRLLLLNERKFILEYNFPLIDTLLYLEFQVSALHLLTFFCLFEPNLFSWGIFGFPIKSSVHFSLPLYHYLETGNVEIFEGLNAIFTMRLTFSISETTDLVLMYISKERFFTEKIWKKTLKNTIILVKWMPN